MIKTIFSPIFFVIILLLISSQTIARSDHDCNILTTLQKGEQNRLQQCWYAGAELNRTLLDPDSNSAESLVTDDSDNGWSIALGWRFLPKSFAEFKYSDQGSAAINTDSSRAEIDYTTRSLLFGYDIINVNEQLRFYLKAGVADIDGNATGDSSIDVANDSVRFAGGAGFEYRWNNPWFARFNADFYSKDVQQFGFSINRYIGGSFRQRAPKTTAKKPSVSEQFISKQSTSKQSTSKQSSPQSTLEKQDIPVVNIGDIDTSTTRQSAPQYSTQTNLEIADTLTTSKDQSNLAIRASEPIPVKTELNTARKTTKTIVATDNLAQQTLGEDCENLAGILKNVKFENNSSYLKSSAKNQLSRYAAILKRYPNTKIKINAHTDSKGDNHYNQWLSERRAQSVATFLNKRGVNANQLDTEGVGEQQPIASNDSDQGRETNRRVEFVIVKSDTCL